MTLRVRYFATLMAAAALLPAGHARATSLTTLYSFPNQTTTPYAPFSGLIQVGNLVYGTTYYGGKSGRGTVFELNPATNAQTTLYSFTGKSGAYPYATLISVGAELYGTTLEGGAAGFGTVFALNPSTGQETVLHSFSGADGKSPAAALLNVNGLLYGTTSAGGSAGYGAIFTIDPSSGTETTVYSFTGAGDGGSPYAGLLNVNGTLYGTTSKGGGYGPGTIYSFTQGASSVTTVYSFGSDGDGGNSQAPLINIGTTLYGTTAGFLTGGAISDGNVFAFDTSNSSFTLLHNFASGGASDGHYPYAALVAIGGNLYGTTTAGGANGYGTVYQVNASTGSETVLASFNSTNGSNPVAAMIVMNGNLYGTTAGSNYYVSGPQNGLPGALPGSVFEVNPTTGTLTDLAVFSGVNPNFTAFSALTAVKAELYGEAAQGGASGDTGVYSIDTGTGKEASVADLGQTYVTTASLIDVKDRLYGTTKEFGPSGYGTVYSANPKSGATKTVYAFQFSNDGAYPNAALLNISGTLYGTAQSGGAYYGGTVFAINPSTGAETTLYPFTFGTDGGYPNSNLIDVGGVLYGTTLYGGASLASGGVIFAVNLATGVESTVYSFTGGTPGSTDGAGPESGVVNLRGTLYGTTPYGGPTNEIYNPYGYGVVYAVNPSTGTENVLHGFTGGSDGGAPQGALVEIKGILYGTTPLGGAHGNGTVYKVNPRSGKFTTIYSFTGNNDGSTPTANLIYSGGKLYGTTNFGGPGNAGTVFSLAP